jgi:hypothetical protein
MINEYRLSRPLKKDFLSGFLKFISKKVFLIYNKRTIKIFQIKKSYNVPILIKLKKIYINSDIVFLSFSQTKNFVYIYDLNHNFRIYNLYTYKKIRTYFLDINLIFLQKSTLTNDIIYAIHTNYVVSDISLLPNKKTYLAIINLNEYKYVNIFQLKNLWFNERSIRFIKKERVVIIIDGDQINILNFSWNYKKIYKKIAYNRTEICYIVSDFNLIMVGDRNGFLNLFRFYAKTSFCKKNCNSIIFSMTKTKSWKFNNIICFMFILKKNELFINLFESSQIIYLNYKSQKKKKIPILNQKKLYILNILIINKSSTFLIATPSDVIFYTKGIYKKKIFDISSLNLLELFNKQLSSISLPKNLNIKLLPILKLSNCFFLLAGPSNNFQLINLSQDLNNFNLFENKLYSKKLSFKLLEGDALGKTNFFLKNFNSFSSRINFDKSLKKLKLIQNFGLKFNYLYFTKKNLQLSIDRKARYIAVKLNNFYVRVLNNNLFIPKKKEFLNVTLFSNKKITALSISDDGSFLALAFFNILTVWELSPYIKKFKTFSINIESSICILKFLALNAREKIVVCSSNKIMLFNLKNRLLVWKYKFKIMELVIDRWSDFFMVKTKYVSAKFQKIIETIVIFDSNSPIPVRILDPMLFFNKSILSFSFSYFTNFKNKKSLIYLDSSFTINKIFI